VSQPETMTIGASALLLAAMLALTSPAQAEPNSCDTAAARDVLVYTLPRAGDERPVNITFRTRAEGVKMPAYLLAQYPDEITIILQYQFDRLVVSDDRFEVTVYFKGMPARLTIPFDAVKTFFDNNVAKCWDN
jgi:Stringent starvation protein B